MNNIKKTVVCCDGCPCLNNDFEAGSECNLDYEIKYIEIKKGEWKKISHNCKLEFIRDDGKDIFPEKSTIEV